jgi:serine/threonine protein phosphatase PrpC
MTQSTQETTFLLSSLRCAAGTDVGMRREENQDSFGIVKSDLFQGFFVADGMGGVNGGAIASRLAISALQELLPGVKDTVSPHVLAKVVSDINSRIFERGNTQPGLAGMGTTLVGLIFTTGGLISINVGDSRAYRIRGSSIKQLSEDHTVVSELVKSGAISNKEAESHPVSHMLTRSLGPLPEVVVETRFETEAPVDGDVYILCSDGLYNFVSDADILEVVKQNPLDDVSQILINIANRRGGADNITIVVISVGEKMMRSRAGEYRSARESVAPPKDVEPTAGTVADSRVKMEKPLEADVSAPRIPPPIAEPKDAESELERVRAKNRVVNVGGRRFPGYLKLIAAVFFGLLVGDVGRRSGAFPDLAAFIESTRDAVIGSGGATRLRESVPTGLQQISKDLQIPGPGGRVKEGLPDIARRVRGESAAEAPYSRGAGASRERSSSSRKLLEAFAEKLEGQLGAMSSMSIDEAAANLKAATARYDDLQGQINKIEMQVDAASRKLSLWFGRKKRLESNNQDVFQPANDLERVGAASSAVKSKIAECTEASYLLQAKQDEFELYPSNAELREEVRKLEDNRERLLAELRSEVDKAVDVVLADTNKQLEELKMQRDLLMAQLEKARDERELLTVLASTDSSQRDALRQRLERELSEAKAGMSELSSTTPQ